jgi:hypothetical protein
MEFTMKAPPWKNNKKQVESKLQDPKTGQFIKGNSGRPRGSKNRITVAIESMMSDEAEEITRRCIDLAKRGDPTALKIVMDRIAPIRKGRKLEGITRKDNESSIETLLTAVLQGELTPEEGKDVVSLIESAARVAANKALSDLRQKQIQSFESLGNDTSGVMIVPELFDPDSWSTIASKQQAKLKKHAVT